MRNRSASSWPTCGSPGSRKLANYLTRQKDSLRRRRRRQQHLLLAAASCPLNSSGHQTSAQSVGATNGPARLGSRVNSPRERNNFVPITPVTKNNSARNPVPSLSGNCGACNWLAARLTSSLKCESSSNSSFANSCQTLLSVHANSVVSRSADVNLQPRFLAHQLCRLRETMKPNCMFRCYATCRNMASRRQAFASFSPAVVVVAVAVDETETETESRLATFDILRARENIS